MHDEEPPGRAQGWSSCDPDIAAFIRRTIDILGAELSDDLCGVYLHGSLAMGSYFRPKSDIDLLVVVAGPLTPERRRLVARALARHLPSRPTVGNLELSVITADTARTGPDPVPYEVHVSDAWERAILADEVDFSGMRFDPDLPAHLTHVRQRGVRLLGPPIPEVFGQVRWRAFMGAVEEDAAWILTEQNLLQTPFYGVLNVCRLLQLQHEGTHCVHSKDEAARWAMQYLPKDQLGVVRRAWTAYRAEENVDSDRRQTAGVDWPEAELLSFRDFARTALNLE